MDDMVWVACGPVVDDDGENAIDGGVFTNDPRKNKAIQKRSTLAEQSWKQVKTGSSTEQRSIAEASSTSKTTLDQAV